MPIEIKCINKSDRNNPHERIKSIGGQKSDGGNWKLSQQQAIADIKSGKYSFNVNVHGNMANVIVATSRNGNEYIKTESDDEESNNLLSLPECK